VRAYQPYTQYEWKKEITLKGILPRPDLKCLTIFLLLPFFMDERHVYVPVSQI
jgi:hypothetical protein